MEFANILVIKWRNDSGAWTYSDGLGKTACEKHLQSEFAICPSALPSQIVIIQQSISKFLRSQIGSL